MISCSKLSILHYKLLRKFVTCDYSVLYSANLTSIAAITPDHLSFHSISNSELHDLRVCNTEFDVTEFNRLDSSKFQCWGLKKGGHWIAYLWPGTDQIPAYHNSNGHAWTGLPLELDQQIIYILRRL